jgi:chromosome segregation ATPase
MSEMISDQIVIDVKKLVTQFESLAKLSVVLEEIGDLRKAEKHLRTTVKALQDEVAVLKGSRDRELEGQHANHRQLLSEQERLRAANSEVTKQIADARRLEKDVQRRIEVGQNKLTDLQNKLGALKGMIPA